MKVINKTGYGTRALKSIVTHVVNQHVDDPVHRSQIRVTFRPIIRHSWSNTTAYASGHAALNGTRAIIEVSGNAGISVAPSARSVAFVVTHEVYHLLGWGHDRMRGTWLASRGPRSNAERFAWADDPRYAVTFKPAPKAKPKPVGADLAATKAEHARGKVIEWERVVRTAQKRAATWKRKAIYHEKREAALRSAQGGTTS